ncbi:MAG: hypothetical protein MUF73_12770 [Rhodobacteraceae bacterium]|jgi:hypothetical protein|nr:hypothetical protein [Paracoccaceae bacterium]
MSGQMSNGEIEGVLASIRRLLRDDVPDGPDAVPGGRAMVSAVAGHPERPSPAQPPRKLVLSPDAMIRTDDGAPAVWPAASEPLVLTDPAPAPTETAPSDPLGGPLAAPPEDPGVAAWSAPLLLSDPVVLPETAVAPPPPADPDPVTLGATDANTASGPDPDPVALTAAVSPPVRRPAASVGNTPTRRPPSLEERIAELEAALARDEATWEPDGGDPAPAVTPDDPQATDAAPPAPDGDGPRPRLGPAEVRAWIEAESLKAFGALPDDIPDAVGSDPAPDLAMHLPDPGAAAAPDDGAPPQDPGDTALTDDLSGVPDLHADTDAGEPPDVPDMADAPNLSALTPMPEPDDAAPWAAPAPVVPPDAPPDALDGTAHPATSDVAADTVPDAAPDPKSDAGPVEVGPASAPHAGGAADDHGLDPELAAAIRALVADTIRAELRGPLGEDLTRNIRRLVRREWTGLSSPSD